MNRLTKTTASALLMVMMAAAPAAAMYVEGGDNTPAEPGMVRILKAPATEPAPADDSVIRILPAPADAPIYQTLPAPIDAPIYHTLPAPISAPAGEATFEILAARPAPASILVNSAQVTYDQQPILVDGTLMLPLRAIVEAAGGQITWDGETQTVTVRLGDRTATFVIGQDEAEMNQDGVRYIQRNMIKMTKAPVLEGSRTLVSADALTNVLGLMERQDAADSLNLIAPVAEIALPGAQPAPAPADELPAPTEPQEWTVEGTIKEYRYEFTGDTFVLVEGAPMANGEGSLTWFSLSAETKIFIVENGTQRDGDMNDFAAAHGLKVSVKPVGPLLMSYPARGGAAEIVIHK